MITFRAHLDKPGCYSHLQVFNLITSVKSLLPPKVTHSQVLGIRMRTSLGVVVLPATQPHGVNVLVLFTGKDNHGSIILSLIHI